MSNELFKTIEAQGRLITDLRAQLENRKVYAVHVMDSLLDYSEQKLFTEYFTKKKISDKNTKGKILKQVVRN